MSDPTQTLSVERFKPEQIVSSRHLQRSLKEVEERLERHGSLLVVKGSRPIGVLRSLSNGEEVQHD